MAEDTYKDSLAEDPSDPYAHADFAYLLSDKGDPNQAFSQLEQTGCEIGPRMPLLCTLIWLGWLKQRVISELASSELEQAIKISPTHAGLWAHLGRVEERKGDVGGAIAAYNRALNVDPGQFEAKRRLQVIKAEEAKTKTAAPDAGTEGAPSTQANPENEPGADKTKEPVKGGGVSSRP